MHPQVEFYINKSLKWRAELEKLREICLNCLLNEDFKWSSPCYTFNKINIVGIVGFKEHFAIWFYNGALLTDTNNLLLKSGEKTQAMRQIRFKSLIDILKIEQELTAYIFEAIELEKSGQKYVFKKITDFIIPEELQEKLNENVELNNAFHNLTPGRKNEYCNYIVDAKQQKTKDIRLEKCIPIILNGKGLNDKYIY